MAVLTGQAAVPKQPALSRSASLGVAAALVVVGLAVALVSTMLGFAAGIGDGNYPSWRIRPLQGAGAAVFLISVIALLVQLSRHLRARSRAWVTGAAVAACLVVLIFGSVQARLRWHIGPSLLSALRHLTPPAGVTVVQEPFLMSPYGPPGPDNASYPQNAYATWHIGGRDVCVSLKAALGPRPGWRPDPGEDGPCAWMHLVGRVRIVAFPGDAVEGAAPGTIHVVAEPND